MTIVFDNCHYVDGSKFMVSNEQKRAILTLVKGIEEKPVDPFEEIEKELPKYAIALRGARKKEDLSQKELSEKTGIDISNISKMENGERKIGRIVAKKLAKVLKISYRVFLI